MRFFTDLNHSNRQKIVFFSGFPLYPAPNCIAININCLIPWPLHMKNAFWEKWCIAA